MQVLLRSWGCWGSSSNCLCHKYSSETVHCMVQLYCSTRWCLFQYFPQGAHFPSWVAFVWVWVWLSSWRVFFLLCGNSRLWSGLLDGKSRLWLRWHADVDTEIVNHVHDQRWRQIQQVSRNLGWATMTRSSSEFSHVEKWLRYMEALSTFCLCWVNCSTKGYK